MMATVPPRTLRALALGALVSATSSSVSIAQEFVRWNGEASHDNFGYSVSAGGDVDADGIEDIIVGAWHVDHASSLPDIQIGGTYVYSGADRQLLYRWVGTLYKDHFGNAVAGGGDANRDGYDDVLVGARMFDSPDGAGGQLDSSGRVYLYSGRDGSLLHSWDGISANDNFGQSVAFVEDINGDGADEILVGADGVDGIGNASGRVYLISGMLGNVVRTFDGEGAGDRFGYSLDAIGDVDGDGTQELLIGAPINHSGATYGGRCYIYSGKTGALLSFVQGAAGDLIGWDVADAGDYNGDGSPDVILGGIYGGGLLSGTTVCCDANTGFVHGSWIGETGNDMFGFQVAGGHDVNGDGLDDVVIGSAFTNGLAQQGGTAYVFAGGSGRLLMKIRHDEDDAWTGHSVAMIEDTNGDGFAEVITGAPGGDYTDDGSVFMAYGNDLVFDAAPRLLAIGDRVEMSVRNDLPGSLVATFITEANGLAMIILVDAHVINARGERIFFGRTTPAMSGLDVIMKSYTVTPGFEVQESNEVAIQVQ